MTRPAAALLDQAVGVATGLFSGRYARPRSSPGGSLSKESANERALRALARRTPGHARAERQAALEAALVLVRRSVALFEERGIVVPPSTELDRELKGILAREFPQFTDESHRQAVTWGIIWFCK